MSLHGIRRTWDKDEYEEKAKKRSLEKVELEKDGDTNVVKSTAASCTKEEFQTAEEGAAGPEGSDRAYLKQRESSVLAQIEKSVGKQQVVTAAAMEAGLGGGFWCETCSCMLKDSVSYLDHINGRKHQRALGFSVRVENVTVEAVRARLKEIKKRLHDDKKNSNEVSQNLSAMEEHDLKVNAREKEEMIFKRRKKIENKIKETSSKNKKESNFQELGPELAEVLGFQSFGMKKMK